MASFFEKMSFEIKETFMKLQDALKSREMELLRQIEVLGQHCTLIEYDTKYSKEISLTFNNKTDLLNSISSLGQINFNVFHCASDVYQIEDYQKLEIDHNSCYKHLEKSSKEHDIESVSNLKLKTKENKSKFSTGEYCVTKISESDSILECIGKDNPKLCQHHRSNKIVPVSKNNFKKKVNNLINNTTENTLNCVKNIEATNSNLKCQCNYFSPVINVQSTKENSSIVECFHCNDSIDDEIKKQNLKHPIQIQHWMNNIILEAELEPTSNNVMEHSQIKNEEKVNNVLKPM